MSNCVLRNDIRSYGNKVGSKMQSKKNVFLTITLKPDVMRKNG